MNFLKRLKKSISEELRKQEKEFNKHGLSDEAYYLLLSVLKDKEVLERWLKKRALLGGHVYLFEREHPAKQKIYGGDYWEGDDKIVITENDL